MPVKRKLWKEPFTTTYVPSWHCPTCNGGYLKIKKDSLHFSQSSQSVAAQKDDGADPEWIDYRFTALFLCNNDRCKEAVVASGTGGVEMTQTSWNDYEYIEFFYPKYIDPSPPFINVPKECPESVSKELARAFTSSWSEFSAAGNHLRAATERLLDHLKEAKTKIGRTGKRERVALHARIVSLGQRDKEISDSLLAIKWLGNSGSHGDLLS